MCEVFMMKGNKLHYSLINKFLYKKYQNSEHVGKNHGLLHTNFDGIHDCNKWTVTMSHGIINSLLLIFFVFVCAHANT